MCDSEPKATENSPFEAGLGLNALAKHLRNERQVEHVSTCLKVAITYADRVFR